MSAQVAQAGGMSETGRLQQSIATTKRKQRSRRVRMLLWSLPIIFFIGYWFVLSWRAEAKAAAAATTEKAPEVVETRRTADGRVVKRVRKAAPQEEPEFDAFAAGYPVPPLPGQKLPPSPRRKKTVDALTPAADAATESQEGTDD